MAGEAGGCRRGDILEEEPNSSQHHDWEGEPLGQGEGHGVQAEVVAELVGQHTGKLIARQRLDGHRGHDDEVPAAGKRVELLRRQHREHVPIDRQPRGLHH